MKFLTPELVVEAMENLPIRIKDKLKKGPLPNRYSCGVCKAFDGMFEGYDLTIDTDDPIYRVWVYHEVPKAEFRHADQNYFGAGANKIYNRCIETYQAAGWEGIAEPENA